MRIVNEYCYFFHHGKSTVVSIGYTSKKKCGQCLTLYNRDE
ncbi:hypothetical protein ASZ90_015066 [hydrocarbon metagenome]|uniref:Uncharacterized protein n=1 Tax=hydrocarbon metagenome TaxID=938273 RepID=A0A0W8F2Z9_9ZZZZ